MSVANHRVFDSFGQLISETNAAVDHLFGFTGRELDEESGLYYYRARYYDPAIGQFVSEDPIGFAAGDANTRRYVGNATISSADPSGLDDDETPEGNDKTSAHEWYLDISPAAAAIAANDPEMWDQFIRRYGAVGLKRLEEVLSWGWKVKGDSIYGAYSIDAGTDGWTITYDTKSGTWYTGWIAGTPNVGSDRAKYLWNALQDSQVRVPEGLEINSDGSKSLQAGDICSFLSNGNSQIQNFGAARKSAGNLVTDTVRDGAIEIGTVGAGALISKGDTVYDLYKETSAARHSAAASKLDDAIRVTKYGIHFSQAYRRAARANVYDKVNLIKKLMTTWEKKKTTFALAEVVLPDGTKQSWISSAGKDGKIRDQLQALADVVVHNVGKVEDLELAGIRDAERKLIREARRQGATIVAIRATRTMCDECRSAISKAGLTEAMFPY